MEGLHAQTSAEQQDLAAALREYALFQGLDPGQLAKLSPALRLKQFQDEEIVCHCPDASHDAFLLLRGTVAVTRKKAQEVHVVQLEGTGAVFNLGPLVGLAQEQAGVRALGSVQTLAMDSALLGQLLESEPRLGFGFARNICRLILGQCERQLERYIE